MMSELDDAHGIALEDDDHAAPNLGCRNCHRMNSIEKFAALVQP
jgi:hypothetical protein